MLQPPYTPLRSSEAAAAAASDAAAGSLKWEGTADDEHPLVESGESHSRKRKRNPWQLRRVQRRALERDEAKNAAEAEKAASEGVTGAAPTKLAHSSNVSAPAQEAPQAPQGVTGAASVRLRGAGKRGPGGKIHRKIARSQDPAVAARAAAWAAAASKQASKQACLLGGGGGGGGEGGSSSGGGDGGDGRSGRSARSDELFNL